MPACGYANCVKKKKSCDRGRAGTGNLISHFKIVHKDEYSVKVRYYFVCLTPLVDETNATGANQVETINVAFQRMNITWENILLRPRSFFLSIHQRVN
jgi:hypothetical protein